jgi:hypothetical protein
MRALTDCCAEPKNHCTAKWIVENRHPSVKRRQAGGDPSCRSQLLSESDIGSIDFLMPQKTHARLFPKDREGRKPRSNSSGG